MFTGNPVYGTLPTTPPGIDGLRYMAGDVIAGMVGGQATPYVPVNQSTFDANIAKNVVGRDYKDMMSRTYGQMGAQMGNTLGAMPFVGNIASMAGYSPEQIQRDLSSMGRSFGGGFAGQIVMPLADTVLNGAGLTGGSFVAAANAAFNNRMHLLSPGTLYSPYNAGQQHQAMGAASSMMSLMNGLMSRTDDSGNLTLLPNHAVTQGFSRERLTQLAMRAAGSGMFNEDGVGGYASRLSQATGGMDLSMMTSEDFTKEGGGGNLSEETAKKIRAFTQEFAHRMKGATEALAAMRDLTKEIDGLEEELDDLTNGDWLRSGTGAYKVRDAVRTLNAVTQMYNLAPKEAIGQIRQNRFVLQSAAGFDPSMTAMGFNGGGMFGLAAQTEMLATVEDMISARGLRGDPIAANRLRMQGTQVMARNMNTMAGRGAQVLAYARQLGVVSEDEAERYRNALTSGDRGLMDDTLNRLLTTTFGSAKKGRELMNDQMYMNSMRQSMNDSAGVFAMQTTMRGADAEFRQQERVTAASQRLAFSKTALAEAGMRTTLTDDGAMRVADSVTAAIRSAADDAGPYADAFKQQVQELVGKGMKPSSAVNAAIASFKKNPVTAKYAGKIDLAVKRQTAENNEYAYLNGGLESRQANDLTRELLRNRDIDGKKGAELYKLIREGKGSEALSQLDAVVGGMTSAKQKLYGGVKLEAAKRYEAAANTMKDNKIAEQLVAAAGKTAYGSQAVAESYTQAITAAQQYLKDGNYDNFWDTFSKSKFATIFGDDQKEKFLKAVSNKDEAYLKQMGRVTARVGQMAASNLKANGYDLHYSGYWGNGIYAGNSPKALEARNDLISQIGARMTEDAELSADDRSTLAQDLVDLVTGEKDWKEALKISGASGKKLTSALKDYGVAYGKFKDANEAYGKTTEGYSKALMRLNQSGKTKTASLIEKTVSDGRPLDERRLNNLRNQLYKDGVNADDIDTIMGSLGALQKVRETQADSERVLVEAAGKEGVGEDLKAYKAVKGYRDASSQKIAGDQQTQAFLAGLDETKVSEAVRKGGKLGDFYKSLKGAVSDEEVAKAYNVKDISEITDKGAVTRKRLDLLAAKAQSGDQAAIGAMEKAAAARREEQGKIRGELTLKIGNESYPAILEGSMGGLG